MIVPYSQENYERLKYVFGIDGYGVGTEVNKDINEIIKTSVDIIKNSNITTESSIEVSVTRKDKSYELTSPEVTHLVLNRIIKEGINVNKKSNTKLMIKIGKKVKIYIIQLHKIYNTRFMNGAGGLPFGITGKVGVMLSGGIDSPVAAWMMMKRGCKPMFIHFHSVDNFNPFTGQGGKIGDILKQLKKYSPDTLTLYAINFKPITKQIVQHVPPSDRLIVYRRYMYRLSEQLLKDENINTLVSGESLAQVASQTLENLSVIDETLGYPYLILRPLIGMDKKEIIALSKHIGIFEHSIKPYDDTCSKFLPKHPTLHANLEQTKSYEKRIGNIKIDYKKFKI